MQLINTQRPRDRVIIFFFRTVVKPLGETFFRGATRTFVRSARRSTAHLNKQIKDRGILTARYAIHTTAADTSIKREGELVASATTGRERTGFAAVPLQQQSRVRSIA